jgi:PAS domain S-box-containing protein
MTIPDDLPRRILEGSPDAVLISDRSGTVVYWNAAAQRIFGFSPGEALGRSLEIIIPEQFRDRHWAAWERVMETGVTRYGDGRLLAVPALNKEGSRLSIEFSIQLLKGPEGRVEHVAAVIRDVTQRYLREKELPAECR